MLVEPAIQRLNALLARFGLETLNHTGGIAQHRKGLAVMQLNTYTATSIGLLF
jgi:hypothetical protein